MLKRFAVIGNPIGHSLSPAIHQKFAQQTHQDLTYEKILGDNALFEQQVTEFFKHNGTGLNITLPYKERAFQLAEVRTPRCELAGAANTLWLDNNKLHADNTDGVGLIRDLNRYLALSEKSVLILGAGGATRGIISPLLHANTQLTVANRSMEKIRILQQEFPQIQGMALDNIKGVFDLIINATSASLGNKDIILPIEIMENHPLCYDLAYKLKEATSFVRNAQNLGCKAVDGLGMLVEQAAESFYIWNGVMPLTTPVLEHIYD